MPGPAKGSIRLTQEHRDKIAKSKVLTRLIRHAEGLEDMSQSEVTAGVALLKKFLPDLKSIDHSGEVSTTIVRKTVYESSPDDA